MLDHTHTGSQTCKRCQLEIDPERLKAQPVICNHCGHSSSALEKEVSRKMEKRVTQWMIGFSFVFVSSYVQLINWDNHSLSVIPLTAKSWMGASTVQDQEEMASICMDLKKWDCVETEYQKVAEQKPEKWFELGHFQMKRQKTHAAAESFYSFFTKVGPIENPELQLEASYLYAQTLAELGQVDDAVTYFEQVLAARPDVLQVTVVQNYVRMLMSHKRYEQAEKLIKNVRSQGPSAESFMESEFKEIREMTSSGTI